VKACAQIVFVSRAFGLPARARGASLDLATRAPRTLAIVSIERLHRRTPGLS
jgi:hypothetical protein